MTKFISLFLSFLIVLSSAFAKEQVLQVGADGKVVQSTVTEVGKRYRITVEGTYSMWPQFKDCHGVDAVYVYDVPQEEIDGFRWPPKEINLGVVVIPFVEIPHWVGDDQLWSFPPKQIATPLFEISFRKHKGFRIDGEPLANSGLNSLHRYQVEKSGTGKPFEFQILDSNYSILEEKMLSRYEDNCGNLTVKIETVEDDKQDMNICDIEPICKDGKFIGVKLWAALFSEDTNSVTGRRNILSEIPLNQIGFVDNGKFICNVDSIVCGGNRKPLSVGLLIDRSGSMSGPIVAGENSIRMESSKKAIKGFIKNMVDNDSAFVVSFANEIKMEVDWTNNKNDLTTAIDTLTPNGSTAFHAALLYSLDHVAASSNPKRALIVLSDGANNMGPLWSDALLDKIRSKNVPIYLVALGFSNTPDDIAGRENMLKIAEASRGKFIEVYSASKLDSVYTQLSQDIASDECCAIYFKMDPCETKSERFIRILYTPQDTILITKVVTFTCDTCSKTTSAAIEIPESENGEINVVPNPLSANAQVDYHLKESGVIEISIYNMLGNKVDSIFNGYKEMGDYQLTLNGMKYEPGTYLLSIIQQGLSITKKVIIIR